MTVPAAVVERLRLRLAEDPAVLALPASDERAVTVRGAVARAVRDEGVLLPADELAALVRELVDVLAGLGPAEPLLRDPLVTDVMLNGPAEAWVERAGRLERADVRSADGAAEDDAVQRVIGPLGLRLARARPFVDARLPDGSRLHAVLPPVAPEGPLVTIRRFPSLRLGWQDLVDAGALTPEAAALLREAVRHRRAIVCCGPTGSGKTTLLGLLLGEVGADERVVLIEEAAELPCAAPHLVRLETCEANVEGAGEVTLRDLVRQSLRMRPDRIVVGEVRGAEIVDVLQAMATGHAGSMTTVHARSADEALVRLEGMALIAGLPLAAVRTQLAAVLDLVVVLGRDDDGVRRVREIAEVERRSGEPVARRRWPR
jgi:pilus assembly protein CpaF